MRLLVTLFAMAFVASSAWAEEGRVVVTLKPLHSLASAIMQGSGQEPLLLVDHASSPHQFSLRPSQVQALEKADIVFYAGDGFELFMRTLWPSLPSDARRVSMEKIPGMTLYPLRENADFAPHDHGEETDHHDEEEYDLHLWLSPSNVRVTVGEMVRTLSAAYPDKKTIYERNEKTLLARLDALDASLRTKLAPFHDKPFVVFHDAYQYFEKAYGVRVIGTVVMRPDQPLSAQHVYALRGKIKRSQAVCVFREPAFDARKVETVVEGTGARVGMLDPEATQLAPGPELYFQLMEKLADGLADCLGK